MKVYAIWKQSDHDIFGYETPMYMNLKDAEAKMRDIMSESDTQLWGEFEAEKEGFSNRDFFIKIEEIDVIE